MSESRFTLQKKTPSKFGDRWGCFLLSTIQKMKYIIETVVANDKIGQAHTKKTMNAQLERLIGETVAPNVTFEETKGHFHTSYQAPLFILSEAQVKKIELLLEKSEHKNQIMEELYEK